MEDLETHLEIDQEVMVILAETSKDLALDSIEGLEEHFLKDSETVLDKSLWEE